MRAREISAAGFESGPMPVGLTEIAALPAVPGVRLGVGSAGLRKGGGDDLVLVELCEGAQTAAVFTRNGFCAAPVQVARDHLGRAMPRLFLINAGNANAGTGEQGVTDARACCAAAARLASCDAHAVLPFSTGVIGEPLPVERIRAALPGLWKRLSAEAWVAAARGIMTTDTVAKGASRNLFIDGERCTVTGIAKGAGMIRPDMATMLAFVATDAWVSPPLLQSCLDRAVEASFNRITVDGDTSTNDACVLTATGHGGVRVEYPGPGLEALTEAVGDVCMELAQAIVRDGEGATKFVTVEVSGGRSVEECLQVAYTIAHSPLIKTAFYASDPNWGRILAAVGRAGIADLAIHGVTIHLNGLCIVRDGARAPDYTEGAGQRVMAQPELMVRVGLGRGAERATVWTTDLSHDYVTINAEYRT